MSQTWIGSQEAPSNLKVTTGARSEASGALAPRASLRLKVTQIGRTAGSLV